MMHDEPATQKAYGYLLYLFVYSILTSRTSSITDYKFPLTTSDDKNAKRLMTAIRNKRSKLETSERLHSFLVPLFSPRPSTRNKWDIPIECFIALRCLRDDGLFIPAKRTTEVFAIFKYLIRCTCLFEANKRRSDFNDETQLYVRFLPLGDLKLIVPCFVLKERSCITQSICLTLHLEPVHTRLLLKLNILRLTLFVLNHHLPLPVLAQMVSRSSMKRSCSLFHRGEQGSVK